MVTDSSSWMSTTGSSVRSSAASLITSRAPSGSTPYRAAARSRSRRVVRSRPARSRSRAEWAGSRAATTSPAGRGRTLLGRRGLLVLVRRRRRRSPRGASGPCRCRPAGPSAGPRRPGTGRSRCSSASHQRRRRVRATRSAGSRCPVSASVLGRRVKSSPAPGRWGGGAGRPRAEPAVDFAGVEVEQLVDRAQDAQLVVGDLAVDARDGRGGTRRGQPLVRRGSPTTREATSSSAECRSSSAGRGGRRAGRARSRSGPRHG